MNLEKLNLVELDAQEVQKVDGGFIPLIIFGTLYSAKCVAAATLAAATVGTAIGIAVYSK
jgi:lactobin A/cerein 7B family class IIb bacteriocin